MNGIWTFERGVFYCLRTKGSGGREQPTRGSFNATNATRKTILLSFAHILYFISFTGHFFLLDSACAQRVVYRVRFRIAHLFWIFLLSRYFVDVFCCWLRPRPQHGFPLKTGLFMNSVIQCWPMEYCVVRILVSKPYHSNIHYLLNQCHAPTTTTAIGNISFIWSRSAHSIFKIHWRLETFRKLRNSDLNDRFFQLNNEILMNINVLVDCEKSAQNESMSKHQAICVTDWISSAMPVFNYIRNMSQFFYIWVRRKG